MKPEYFQTVFKSALPAEETPHSFAVITASNPGGEIVSAEQNNFLMRELRFKLEETTTRHWPVNGCSPDLVHCELGFGVEVDLRTAIALGRRLRQEAIYWIHYRQLFVVDCRNGEELFVDDWAARAIVPNSGSLSKVNDCQR